LYPCYAAAVAVAVAAAAVGKRPKLPAAPQDFETLSLSSSTTDLAIVLLLMLL
jgi:hypothetical protein